MELNNVFVELQRSRQDNILLFRKLISITSLRNPSGKNLKEWQIILAHIIETISSCTRSGNEYVLLASHAFYTLLSTQCNSQFFRDTIIYFQNLDSCNLRFLDKQYTISDLELFKLFNAHGYLQVNIEGVHFDDAFVIMFDVIYRNSIKYTRYSYFAYKVLYAWLKRTLDTPCFWHRSRCSLEEKLEAVIFSNWSNALSEICKQNALIFNTYLRIMSRKYNGFLEHVLKECIDNISWQNETKYIILAEVCSIHENIKIVITKDFLLSLCISLTNDSLHCGGTRLYLTIVKRLSEDEWKKLFEKVIKFVTHRWETGEHENHNALRILFKYWLEPTIKMHRSILPFLWELCNDTQGYYFRSYLRRIAAQFHVELSHVHEMDRYINDKEEAIRLNTFAVLCYRASHLIDMEQSETDVLSLIKQFLWFNANAATIFMREGMIKYYKILYSSILKTIAVTANCAQSVSDFTNWLHEYFLDCFEIGSCYQCKILALNLYKSTLAFTNGMFHSNCANHKECIRYNTAIEKHLKIADSWKFTDKKNLFILFRLVLDPALDVRQLAATLILQYFKEDVLTTAEKHVLYNCAWEHCNSSKFYKIESGAALMKIIAHWWPLNETNKNLNILNNRHDNILTYSSYSEFLLYEAQCQLTQMKLDILKATVKNKPFYGVLTALLAVTFRVGPENWVLTKQFTERLLNLLKEAVDFFLSTLSTKASNTAYSSSFAEMGLAIDEKIRTSEIDDSNYDDLQLSPAHQVLISCIWMSLKVSCEIASEIGMLMQSDAEVKCSTEIIVTVLLKCRHKGVVESAGTAIGNLSRRLYNREEYSKLPEMYLTSLLEEDADKSLHLTRRGAGLSIMFHKLVVGDDRKERPMVHLAVQTLLRSLANFSDEAAKSTEPGQDSPWAKRLHFLRTLVADKEIHSQIISYMEDICLMCFKCMESEVWTVRNAVLQLYGAVIPRLAGQCSGRGDCQAFGNGYSINHFATHYPALASHVSAQLENARLHGASSAMLHRCSSVIPVLILLSKVSAGGSDFIDYPSRVFAWRIKRSLPAFFDNPMMHVRRLSAKAYTALTSFTDIEWRISTIKESGLLGCNVNTSHGRLLTIKYMREKLVRDTKRIDSPCEAIDDSSQTPSDPVRCGDILKYWETTAPMCYVTETLMLEERGFITDGEFLTETLTLVDDSLMSSQKSLPGYFQFIAFVTQSYAEYVKRTNDINAEIVRKILDSDCTELSVEFLNRLSHCAPLLPFILDYLLSSREHCNRSLLDEIARFTLRTLKHAFSRGNELRLDDETMKRFHRLKAANNCTSTMRMKRALTLALSVDDALINEVLEYAFSISMNEEQFVRSTAAEYVELSAYRFARLDSGNRLMIMRCSAILLKDEIAEIRKIVSLSLQKHVFRQGDSVPQLLQHEEIVYQRVLAEIIHCQTDNDNVHFIRYFTGAIKDRIVDVTIQNPFNHDDNIFYREEQKFLSLCYLYRKGARDKDASLCAIQARRELEEEADFDCKNLEVVLHLKEMEYLARKRDIVVQQN